MVRVAPFTKTPTRVTSSICLQLRLIVTFLAGGPPLKKVTIKRSCKQMEEVTLVGVLVNGATRTILVPLEQRFNLGQYFLTVHGSTPSVSTARWHHSPAWRLRWMNY